MTFIVITKQCLAVNNIVKSEKPWVLYGFTTDYAVLQIVHDKDCIQCQGKIKFMLSPIILETPDLCSLRTQKNIFAFYTTIFICFGILLVLYIFTKKLQAKFMLSNIFEKLIYVLRNIFAHCKKLFCLTKNRTKFMLSTKILEKLIYLL